MLRKILSTVLFMSVLSYVLSQDSVSKKGVLSLSGSVDGYYRFNLANAKDHNATNNYTSFTNSQNSFELGMASIKADYTVGKMYATLDLGFGSRAQEFSYTESGAFAAVKQAYLSYTPSDKIKLTLGKWATHVGYEVLDPQFNRNYSMSYMFSFGPFSHTGIKADIGINEHFKFMVGIANPNDHVSAGFSKKYLLAQFSVNFNQFSAFLNYAGGKDLDNANNNQAGLSATAVLSDMISLGYDGTVKFYTPKGGKATSWWGSAVYFNADFTKKIGLTLRSEYFEDKKGIITYTNEDDSMYPLFASDIVQTTLSFNYKPAENFIIIPEFRLDKAGKALFMKNNGTQTKSTKTFILAAIFSF